MFNSIKPVVLRKIFAIWQAENPTPTTELLFDNDYQLLIAVVMSAQTTDKAVNAATKKIFPHIKTPEDMLLWGEDNLRDSIRTIGLYRTKAKNVITLSSKLMVQHKSQVPQNMKALMALPGVGLKTASVIMNTLYGAPMVAVDTHVFRLSRRLGLADGKNAEQVATLLPSVIPKKYLQNAHHWLILHGRYVCTARQPQCESCSIADYCPKNEL